MESLPERMEHIDQIAKNIDMFCDLQDERSPGQIIAALILATQRRSMRSGPGAMHTAALHLRQAGVQLDAAAERKSKDG